MAQQKRNDLQKAICAKNVAQITEFIRATNPDEIKEVLIVEDKSGMRFLYWLIHVINDQNPFYVEVVRNLMSGLSTDERRRDVLMDQWTLWTAALDRSPEMVNALLGSIEDDHIKAKLLDQKATQSGYTVLMRAVVHGSPEMVNALLGSIKDDHIKAKLLDQKATQSGQTVLMRAAHEGRYEVVRIIMEKHLSPDNLKKQLRDTDNKGRTVLILAAENGCTGIVRFILQSLIDDDFKKEVRDAKDKKQRTAADAAWNNGHFMTWMALTDGITSSVLLAGILV